MFVKLLRKKKRMRKGGRCVGWKNQVGGITTVINMQYKKLFLFA